MIRGKGKSVFPFCFLFEANSYMEMPIFYLKYSLATNCDLQTMYFHISSGLTIK